MDYNQIKISTHQAEEILFNLFHIKGKASELPGEIDFNFRIKVEDSEGFILKISRPNENVNYLDFQQKLLQFVEQKGSNITSPKVILDKENNAISEITDNYGKIREVRLLTWVSGRVWSSVNPVNGLVYGYGGVKLFPTEKTLMMDTSKPDMTTSISNKFVAMRILILHYLITNNWSSASDMAE